jgi:AcrR family transcriptional regulator
VSVGAQRARQERPGKAAMMRAAVSVMGEDGYEGASMRDIAARAGVSVAALYYHFPSKQDLLREFLDEAYDVMLARLDRRLAAAGPTPEARLDEVVATLVASRLHDGFARQAANVAYREYTRLNSPERASIEAKRRRLLAVVEGVLDEGIADGAFTVATPHEAAHAIVTLCTSLFDSFAGTSRPMTELITIYQGFARGIAGATAATGRAASSRPHPA